MMFKIKLSLIGLIISITIYGNTDTQPPLWKSILKSDLLLDLHVDSLRGEGIYLITVSKSYSDFSEKDTSYQIGLKSVGHMIVGDRNLVIVGRANGKTFRLQTSCMKMPVKNDSIVVQSKVLTGIDIPSEFKQIHSYEASFEGVLIGYKTSIVEFIRTYQFLKSNYGIISEKKGVEKFGTESPDSKNKLLMHLINCIQVKSNQD